MEPWDGPASIAFTDGKQIGAVLDRNGLRPSRYYVTKDDLVIMGSEVGVLDDPAGERAHKGRLQPGRMFLVDLEQGRIIADDEMKQKHRHRAPLRRVARREHDHAGGSARRPPAVDRARPRAPLLRAAAGVRLHQRGPEAPAGADGRGRRRGDRLDGQRHAAGRPLGPAATALQLLQAALRPGHEPAGRRIREEIIMSIETTFGPRAQPARADARVGPADQAAHRRSCTNEELEQAASARRHAARTGSSRSRCRSSSRSSEGGDGPGAGAGRAVPRRPARRSQTGYDIIILSDRGIDARARADPGAAGRRRRCTIT